MGFGLLLCGKFKTSVQNRDYRHLDELMNWLTSGNERSWCDNGILIACGVARFGGGVL